jgi:hypothetical protein
MALGLLWAIHIGYLSKIVSHSDENRIRDGFSFHLMRCKVFGQLCVDEGSAENEQNTEENEWGRISSQLEQYGSA